MQATNFHVIVVERSLLSINTREVVLDLYVINRAMFL